MRLGAALGRLPRTAQVFLAAVLSLVASSELPFDWNLSAKHAAVLDGVVNVEKILLLYLMLCMPAVLMKVRGG